MSQRLIATAHASQLVVVDLQTRLANVMPVEAMQLVIQNTAILLQAAKILAVSTLYTEQYPKGLGHTVSELLPFLEPNSAIEKTAFSCLGEPKFKAKLNRDKPQIILSGMEAHICLLQTALDLVTSNYQVFIAEDAIISRNPTNKANAIARLREAGCIISNTESICFEWLGKAEGDAFKTISKLIR